MIYLTNPWVWGAVNMISRGIARLPLYTYQNDDQGFPVRVRSDVAQTPGAPTGPVLLDAFNRRPSQTLSRFAHWKGTVTDRLVYGNALWNIVDRPGYPTEAIRKRWRSVIDVPTDSNGFPAEYVLAERDYFGDQTRLAAGDVVHFGQGEDSETCLGVSPLEACSATLALHDAIVRALVADFENGMRLSGQFKVEGKLTPAKAADIRQMILEAYASPENAGEVLVTSADFQPVSSSRNYSEIVELIAASREEIAASYAVPPPVLGLLERAIKSNVTELRGQFYRDCLGPWGSEFESELEAQLLVRRPSWQACDVGFYLVSQLLPDPAALADMSDKERDVRTIDERRELIGLRPLRLAGVTDRPWAASGALPLDTAKVHGGAQPAAAPAAGFGAHAGGLNGHEPDVREIVRDELEQLLAGATVTTTEGV